MWVEDKYYGNIEGRFTLVWGKKDVAGMFFFHAVVHMKINRDPITVRACLLAAGRLYLMSMTFWEKMSRLLCLFFSGVRRS
jgi:hypothetical protein